VIVRLVEISGRPQPDVRVSFAAPIIAAREINGAEEPVGPATVSKGKLVTSFSAFQPRTFAVKLGKPPTKLLAPKSVPVTLPYDLAVASRDETKSAPGFDANGLALPAEMLPTDLGFRGIRFNLAPAAEGKPNAVVAKGQTLNLPAGKFNRVYVLAASAAGDQKATFRAGDKSVDLTVQNWGGFIGQWDDRTWNVTEQPTNVPGRTRTLLEFTGVINPGFIKPADVAWFASHHHTADGANEPYAYSYLFAYPIDLPANARTLTLPDNDKIRVLAITAASVK